MDELALKVRKIILDEVGSSENPEDVSDEALIGTDLGADSLDNVQIIMNCEAEFSVSVTDEEAEAVKTVGDCVTLVRDKVAAK